MSFSTSATLDDYPLLLVMKKTFWGKGSFVISYEHICILSFGLMYFGAWPHRYFIKIQAVQMMNVIYGDMTLYGHTTIIKGIISPYIDQSQYCPHVI